MSTGGTNSKPPSSGGSSSGTPTAGSAASTSAVPAAATSQDEGMGDESSIPSMNLTSDEVNYLIYRYMQECGYVHSAFTFVYESMLGRSNIRNAEKSIPPGALINFLQKGLQYVGIEESLYQESNRSKKQSSNQEPAGLSLLSTHTVAALTREAPPIQLNVPPASAAAAVRARLEVEAQQEATRKAAAIKAMADNQASAVPPSKNGRKPASDSAGLPPQLSIDKPTIHTDEPPKADAQRQSALDVNTSHSHAASNGTDQTASPPETAGTAAFVAQQRRAVAAEMAALKEQQQQLQLQQQQHMQDHQERLRQLKLQQQQFQLAASVDGTSAPNKLDASPTPVLPSSVASSPTTAASAAPQQSGVKRSLSSSKKTQKTKGKSSRQKTSSPKGETKRVTSPAALPSQGFASLTEAVSQSEALNQKKKADAQKSKSSNKDKSTAMDVDETDAADAPKVPAHEKATALKDGLNGNATKEVNGKYAPHDAVSGKKRQKQKSSNGGRAAQIVGRQAQPLPEAVGGTNAASGQPSDNGADQSASNGDDRIVQSRSEVLDLKLHSSEVFMCAWNPIFTDIIATGSGDASARIWKMGGPKASDGLGPVKLLPHGIGPADNKNKDVTTLEWSSDGKLLATGSYDGVARVWSQTGALVHTLQGHQGPIFSLKWNKRGNFLLSGSYDKSTIVWDVSGSTGFIQQQFNEHQEPALDVDWKDDMTFASCSTDKTVHICRVGVPRPLKIYRGHADEVNAVKWDPSGRLLASCSDDCTAKIWDLNSDRVEPLHDFKSHEQEIYTVKWSPTGPGSLNPEKLPLLATASFDGSVRLWNVIDGSCYRVFSRHHESVYSVAFSPSGDFLASGSLAGQLYIWNVQLGVHIKSFKGEGDIFEVAWNKEETRVAACFSSHVVSIIDFHR